MKKIFYVFIAFFILFLYAFGQPHTPYGQGKMGGGMPRHGADKMLGGDPLHFFRKAGITLTENQTNRIYDIAIKFFNEEQSIRLEIEKIDYDMRNELIKEKPDREILRDLINAKKEREAVRDYLIISRDLDIIEVLTPEQRVQLSKCRMR